MKILVVDDHDFNRELLSFILQDESHDCVEAVNGLDAIEKYKQEPDIDLILMDINMPELDGISATKEIKSLREDHYVPVIFVTALDDFDMLSRCLEAGGDDFVPKPVNENVLVAKINAHSRTKNLYARLSEVNQKLYRHQQQVEREHLIVERVFERSTKRVQTKSTCSKTYTSPASMFNGDVVLEAPSPSGGVYHLVGDFTGHGLSASIGTLPVTDIFYALASKQASVAQIAKEMNSRLVELLPDNMFFCATLAYLNPNGNELTIWSGGMNDMLLYSPNKPGELTFIQAEYMPIGILPTEEFEDNPTVVNLNEGDRVYIYTDGVNEANNMAREEFGLERLQEIVRQGGANVVEKITDAVHRFTEGCEQSDDISLLELTAQVVEHRSVNDGSVVDVRDSARRAQCFPWRFDMTLENEDLQNLNIVDQIMRFIGSIKGVELHRDKIFMILSELYNNALELGVLNLDSSLKHSADGFEEYYRLRSERLSTIADHSIQLNFSYHKAETDYLKLVITDSGKGFDTSKMQHFLDESNDLHGRGLPLLFSLCKKIEYSNGGRTVEVHYELGLDNL